MARPTLFLRVLISMPGRLGGAGCLVALLLLLAVCADGVGGLLGFRFDEMDPTGRLMPPGADSLPSHYRDFSGDDSGFSVLDADGSGTLQCSVGSAVAGCPELTRAQDLLRELQWVWEVAADTSSFRYEGVPASRWDEALSAAGGLERRAPFGSADLDSDRDGHVQYNEFVAGTSSLHFGIEDFRRFDADRDNRLTPQEYPGSAVPRAHWLGTDRLGRDLAVRLLYGLRVSLLIALAATAVSLFLGALVGLSAGYLGGPYDRGVLRVTEVLQSLPFVFVVILVSVYARSVFDLKWADAEKRALMQSVVLFCALGAIQWFSLARYARGLAVDVSQADFVKALRGMGFSTGRILMRHLLPNTLRPILAYAVLLVPMVVLEEAFLSYLGFGVQPPYPSLGLLMNQGVSFMDLSPVMLIAPALCILLLTWSLNAVGERLARKYSGQGPAKPEGRP